MKVMPLHSCWSSRPRSLCLSWYLVLSAASSAAMEDSKLQRLHDTLRKLAPKGNHVSGVCLGSSRDLLVEGFQFSAVRFPLHSIMRGLWIGMPRSKLHASSKD